MIEFIVGAAAGIYVYKRVAIIQKFIDFNIVKYYKKVKDYVFSLRYKIVYFSEGKYAIRKWELGYEYLDIMDFPDKIYWWSGTNYIDKYCTTDLTTCDRIYAELSKWKSKSKNGTPI